MNYNEYVISRIISCMTRDKDTCPGIIGRVPIFKNRAEPEDIRSEGDRKSKSFPYLRVLKSHHYEKTHLRYRPDRLQ
jgi:hypothetical protein